MISDFRRIAGIFCVVALLTAAAVAQISTGSINGQVTDPSGAAIPGAQITAVDLGTSKTYTGVSGSDGNYVINALPYSFYKVTIKAKGFADLVVDNVQVNVGQIARIEGNMKVASVGTEVVVSGEQSAVQTESAEIKNSIDTRQIRSLPLSTRNPLDLIKTMAGATITASGTGGDYIIHGLRPNTVNLMQDGVNVSDNYVKTSSFFSLVGAPVDSVGEFTVTTSAAGGDSGFGSTQVTIATASGTNTLKGSVYWYQRTSFLNANPYFNGLTGQPNPFQLQNRIGYQIGGPVIIPKLYHGKNKTFFFHNLEIFRQPAQQNTNRLVMSDAARLGNFTYTPTCGVGTQPACPAGVTPGVARTINLLSFGTIGTSATTPTINSNVMGFYNSVVPSPNNDTCANNDAINVRCFTWNAPSSTKSNRYVARIDQNLGSKHVASATYNALRTTTLGDFLNGDFKFFPKAYDGGQGGIRELFAWALRSTFGNNRTNNASFGISRAPVDFILTDPGYSDTGGYQINTGGNLSNISVTSTNLPQGRNTPVWEAHDDFGWVRGHHNITFGGVYRQVRATNYLYNAVIPNVNLGTSSTNPDSLSARVPGGLTSAALTAASSVFDTLTGLISSTVQGFNHTSATSGYVAGRPRLFTPIQHNFGFYGQDSWKFRPNLTITAGLRWEFQGVFDTRDGLVLQPDDRMLGVFGPAGVGNVFNPVATAAATDVLFAPAGGHNNKPLYNKDWNNFAPTVGFAWAPGKEGKTAVRGAFSSHFTTDGFTNFAPASTGNTGFFSTVTNSLTTGVFNPASVPLPATPADLIPVSSRLNFGSGTAASVNTSDVIFNPNMPVPYVLEWNFAVQREVPWHLTVEARYIGNHAVKLYRTTNYNEQNYLNNPYTASAANGGASVANLLTEFVNAQNNLTICTNNRVACTGSASGALRFNQVAGLAGMVPTPILQSLFTGLAAGSGFQSSTFVQNLQQNNIFTMIDTLRRSATYFTNRTNNFPLNFFVPNPWVNNSTLVDNSSWSNYHGGEFEVRRRFSNGLFFQANYTFSKVITDQRFFSNQTESQNYLFLANRALDRGRAPFDVTHNIATNFLYPLPFGRGQLIGKNVGRGLDMVLGGWQVQGVVTWNNTNGPTSFTSGRLTASSGLTTNAVLRNMSPSQLKSQLGIFKVPGAVFYINPASGLMNITTTTSATGIPTVTSTAVICTAGQTTPCFDYSAPGQYGNLSFLDYNLPGLVSADASIIKQVKFNERGTNLEFRLEAFNAINHANFTTPSTGITSSTFGRLTGQLDLSRGGGQTSRLMQWAIRINF